MRSPEKNTGKTPPQGASYSGLITDTSRWTHFKHRPDDIFICTPPKCGTTWTQAICAMLIFGTPEHGQQTGVISPWIDANFAPIQDYLVKVEAQPHRRYLKTHTPLDGIPYHPSCAYLAIFRDPRDVFLSGINHRDNMTDQDLANANFPNGPDAFRGWLLDDWKPDDWDAQTLGNLVHMFRTYWSYRDLANVHLYHYSNMKRDLTGTIASMAGAIGVEINDARLEAYAAAASFGNMKSNAEQFAPESGTGLWKAESGFFASGTNGQWQDKLTDDELAAFDARLAELLPPDQAAWLLNGDG
jgi:aryl sulfotransferase